MKIKFLKKLFGRDEQPHDVPTQNSMPTEAQVLACHRLSFEMSLKREQRNKIALDLFMHYQKRLAPDIEVREVVASKAVKAANNIINAMEQTPINGEKQ